MTDAPNRIRVRMYTVGFGDCFLVTFGYPVPVDGRDERHMLVDFGTKDLADGGPSTGQVAEFIARDCNGKLDVLVVSHRHQDHLSGFGSAGDVIAPLQPDAVIRSWTEDPDLPADAAGPLPLALRAAHAGSLDAGQDLADAIAAMPLPEHPTPLRRALKKLVEYEGKNKAAVEQLRLLSEGGRGRYASFGTALGLEDILPGVSIDVLGPPMPADWDPIRSQTPDDPEFWLRLAQLLPMGLDSNALALGALDAPVSDDRPEHPGASDARPVSVGPAHWVIDRVERGRLRSAMRIVRWLDRALNNTSLILLVEAAGRRMLFPGDAQIENWSYVLTGRPDSADWLNRVAAVDLYKVSHHGSRNATPKLTLYPRWRKAADNGARLLSMMSTLTGTFDEENPVPSAALSTALGVAPMRIVSSQPPAAGPTRPHVDAIAGPGGGPFEIVAP